MKNKILLLILFVFSISCFAQTNENKEKFFKTTIKNITLNVPMGFEAIQNQDGFLHKGSASTLMINEVSNSPFSFSASYFDAKNLEKDGAKLIEQQNVKTASGMDAILFTLSLSIKGQNDNPPVDFERMILLTGNDNKTICIVANYPVMIKKLIQETLKSSMLSVVIN